MLVVHPASSELCFQTALSRYFTNRVAARAFGTLCENSVKDSTSWLCRGGVCHISPLVLRAVSRRRPAGKYDCLERVTKHWWLPTLRRITTCLHSTLSASSSTSPAVAQRHCCQPEAFWRQQLAELLPSGAHFSSSRTVNPTEDRTAPEGAPESDIEASERVPADVSVQTVAEYLMKMLRKQVRSDAAIVTPETELESLLMRDDRHWDCLDTVEYLLDVEELFNIVIPDEVADRFRTIQEIAEYVTKHHAETANDGEQVEMEERRKRESLGS